MTTQLKATNATTLRNRTKRFVTVALPSHTEDSPFVVDIRSVGLEAFVRSGKIPNILIPIVNNIFQGRGEAVVPDMNTTKELSEFMQFLYDIATEMIVSHKVVPEITDYSEDSNQIPYDAFTFGDLGFLLGKLNQPIEALARFLEEQASRLEHLQAEQLSNPLTSDQPSEVGETTIQLG